MKKKNKRTKEEETPVATAWARFSSRQNFLNSCKCGAIAQNC
jgi:hypothetical protein